MAERAIEHMIEGAIEKAVARTAERSPDGLGSVGLARGRLGGNRWGGAAPEAAPGPT